MRLFRRDIITVRVHQGYFTVDENKVPHYFINILNISKKRNAVITHIWFATKDGNFQVAVIQAERELPVKVTPYEQWETWIECAKVGIVAFDRVRVRLSNGDIYKSTIRKNVPSSGIVPGDS